MLVSGRGQYEGLTMDRILAVKSKELDKLRATKGDKFPLKRDSVLRMNLAKAVEPYRQNAVFTQSPQFAGGDRYAFTTELRTTPTPKVSDASR